MNASAIRLFAVTGGLVLSLAAGQALAQTPCEGVGVITRIEGDPATVSIVRATAPLARPRVLEVVCAGDHISTTGATNLTLSLDGRGVAHVDAQTPLDVQPSPPPPSLAGNAYRSIRQDVAPDMKRLAWDVRLKGPGPNFAFALPQLASGGQELTPGRRALLVRLIGGTGPFRGGLTGPAGDVQATSQDSNLLFPATSFTPGRYHLTARDGAGGVIEADFTVSATPIELPADFNKLTDAEVRMAALATTLAKSQSSTHGLEAEELLAAAPANGLDRSKVYDLIESYGAD
jgi:hypothetical protein